MRIPDHTRDLGAGCDRRRCSPQRATTFRFYPPDKRAQRMRRATVIVVTMIAGVLSCIAAVYAFRWYMIHGAAGRWGRRWGEIITSLLNSVQIHILNMFYKTVAVALTGKWWNRVASIRRPESAVAREPTRPSCLFCFCICFFFSPG